MNLSIIARTRRAAIPSFVCVLTLSLVGCNKDMQSSPTTTIQAPQFEMIDKEGMGVATITTPREFSDLLHHQAVILHFDADWSFYSVQSRLVVAELRRAMAEDQALSTIKLRRIDITHQDSLLLSRVRDYLESQNADRSLMTTCAGAISWIHSGTVVDSIHDATDEGLPKLIDRSRRNFERNSKLNMP